jgi:hypothetical protein
MSDEYWLISVPNKSTARQTYDELCQATGRDQLSLNYIFPLPDLKVDRNHYRTKSSVILVNYFNRSRLALLIHW